MKTSRKIYTDDIKIIPPNPKGNLWKYSRNCPEHLKRFVNRKEQQEKLESEINETE